MDSNGRKVNVREVPCGAGGNPDCVPGAINGSDSVGAAPLTEAINHVPDLCGIAHERLLACGPICALVLRL